MNAVIHYNNSSKKLSFSLTNAVNTSSFKGSRRKRIGLEEDLQVYSIIVCVLIRNIYVRFLV